MYKNFYINFDEWGWLMIEQSILELYRRFRLETFREIFSKVHEKEGSLRATEAFSAAVIDLMDEPTVTEFADFIGISQPNATYKVNSLVQKGYIEKFSQGDKRKTRLRVAGKFRAYYPEAMIGFKNAVRMLRERFTKAQLDAAAVVIDALCEYCGEQPLSEKETAKE